jgi:hypothetical protein
MLNYQTIEENGRGTTRTVEQSHPWQAEKTGGAVDENIDPIEKAR